MHSFISNLLGPRKIDSDNVEKVINAYGKTLRNGRTLLRDISELPPPKYQIKAALQKAILLTPQGEQRNALESSYISLGDFQNLEECKAKRLDSAKCVVEEARSLFDELQQLKSH